MLIDRRNRVLIAQRPKGKALAGAWEFPGGKLEPGEEPKKALERELAEELGLGIENPRPLVRLMHTYDHARVLLDIFVVRRYHGRILAREDQALKWVRRSELHHEALLPADRPIPRLLRLPERLRHALTRAYRVLPAGSLSLGGRGARAPEGETGGGVGAPLLGVLCRSTAELAAVAHKALARPAGSARGGPARGSAGGGPAQPDGGAAGPDFFVLAERCADEELAALCADIRVPVYARGLSLEHAWSLGASGVHSIV